MSGKARITGIIACIIVALDCFGHGPETLGVPHWLWVVTGIGWLLSSLRFLGESA